MRLVRCPKESKLSPLSLQWPHCHTAHSRLVLNGADSYLLQFPELCRGLREAVGAEDGQD